MPLNTIIKSNVTMKEVQANTSERIKSTNEVTICKNPKSKDFII
ncbi:hypothetical protein SA19142_11750 [Staphylococcus argenteus]|nr:hypothetical protein SARG0275_03550 [Staphylococcus argenteus]GBU01600.1 hypothetical protein SARG0275_06790 [Staphylococcus argenteus]GJF36719.1 hypothetical protein SA19023_14740 [Staphylococcus argenteus]GJF69975.1 hypothetical protein SA19142_11750 [Staphylococcus argenteus]GJF80637.1 hypothetical protein SA19252_16000 [Staphylococcus argenteus]